MADVGIEQLKEDIQADIKANNNQTITGDLLQERLIDTVDTLKGYTDDHVSVSQNTIMIGNTATSVTESYFININELLEVPDTPYESRSLARVALPILYRKVGLIVTYLVDNYGSTEWVMEQFIGDDIDDWTVSENWTIAPKELLNIFNALSCYGNLSSLDAPVPSATIKNGLYVFPSLVGTYTNYGLSVSEGEFCIFVKYPNSNVWVKFPIVDKKTAYFGSALAKMMSSNIDKADYHFEGDLLINSADFFVSTLYDNGVKGVGIVKPFSLDINNQSDYLNVTKWDGTNINGYYLVIGQRPTVSTSRNITNVKFASIAEEAYYRANDWLIICTVRLLSNGERHILNAVAPINFADEILTGATMKSVPFIPNKTLIVSSIADYSTNGQIYEDGHFQAKAGRNVANPIEIPDGINAIVFTGGTLGTVPDYVNCYKNNDFTGFLGRSNDIPFAELIFSADYVGVAQILPKGTKYISFLTVGSGGRGVSTDCKIYGCNVFQFGYKSKDNQMPFINKREYQSSPIRFTIPVNCNMADNDSNTLLLQDENSIYNDWGVLILPENYSASGKPVPLIISCHGAGGNVTATSSSIESWTMTKYLVANGFAVMDMNGLPEAYATEKTINLNNNVGNPFGVQSYVNGWQYVSMFYNLMPFPMLLGGSMGGLMSINLAQNNSIKAIAHAIGCPVTDTYNQLFLHPWQSGAPKIAMGKIYGFEIENNDYVYNENKLKGYNPITNGLFSFDENGTLVSSVGTYDYTNQTLNGNSVTEYKKYPCPVKIWHCQDDATVNYGGSVRFVNAIRNAGGDAQLRSLPSGGHEPWDAGVPIDTPCGNTTYRQEDLSELITPVIEEMFLFFKRYVNKCM